MSIASWLMVRRELFRGGEPARLFRAFFLLVEAGLRLRLQGFARVHAALQPGAGGVGAAEWRRDTLEEARRVARSLRRAARLVPGTRCLLRALALLLWLRRRGVAAELRIGLRRNEDTLEGHAWVEWGGTPLDDDPAFCDAFRLLG